MRSDVTPAGIGPDDLVLDVGSGGDPYPRSDVLCDKFIDDSTERLGNELVRDRPVVQGDVQRLPFKDGAFDYVIASHVLEHVEDPIRAARELCRVGKRGYVECPSELGERLYPHEFHRWFVNEVGGELAFTPRRMDYNVGNLFHALFEKNVDYYQFFLSHRDLFFISLEWDREIKLRVLDNYEQLVFYDGEVDKLVRNTADGYDRLGARLIRAGRALTPAAVRSGLKKLRTLKTNPSFVRHSIDLTSLLCCPDCRGELIMKTEDRLRCEVCGVDYEKRHGIFRLEAKGLEQDEP